MIPESRINLEESHYPILRFTIQLQQPMCFLIPRTERLVIKRKMDGVNSHSEITAKQLRAPSLWELRRSCTWGFQSAQAKKRPRLKKEATLTA